MSHYFDNQTSWEWHVDNEKAVVVTDHGTHTHTLDLTDVSVGELSDNPGKVLGDAHRAAPHDFKTTEESEMASEKNSFLERIRCDQATIDKVNAVSRNSNQPAHRTAEVTNDGGRERGDEGPGSLGRESGLKGESANEAGTSAASQNGTSGQNAGQSGTNSTGEGTGGQSGGPGGGQGGGPGGGGPGGGQGGQGD